MSPPWPWVAGAQRGNLYAAKNHAASASRCVVPRLLELVQGMTIAPHLLRTRDGRNERNMSDRKESGDGREPEVQPTAEVGSEGGGSENVPSELDDREREPLTGSESTETVTQRDRDRA
jgi:hypothetical protein